MALGQLGTWWPAKVDPTEDRQQRRSSARVVAARKRTRGRRRQNRNQPTETGRQRLRRWQTESDNALMAEAESLGIEVSARGVARRTLYCQVQRARRGEPWLVGIAAAAGLTSVS